MLNAAAISSAANEAPSPALGSLAAQENRFASPSAPSFSQVFSGIRTTQPQSSLKPSATARSPRETAQQNSPAQATAPHAPQDSATQSSPAPNPQSSAPIAQPLTAAEVPSTRALEKIAAALSADGGLDPLPVSDANLSATQSAASATESAKSNDDADAKLQSSASGEVSDMDAGAQTSGAQSIALDEGPSTAVSVAATKNAQTGWAVSGPAGAAQSPDSTKSVSHAQPQLQLSTPGASSGSQAKDAIAAQSLQPQPDATKGAAAQQSAGQTRLPDGVSIASAGSSGATLFQNSAVENRELISQKIQANLASSLPSAAPCSGGAIQSAPAASENNSGNGSAQNGHSQDQSASQSSSTQHSADDNRAGSSSSFPSSTAQSGDLGSGTQQTAAAASANSAVMPAASSSSTCPHATAPALAQADASASASASANSRSTVDVGSSASRSLVTASLPPDLPRSLNDVNQATQLYQRVGGAEMHIAMDTDLLGSIDLRAVVHQGSLSATIGVQRADVQTLLVNELPALQHSLTEKNLQVGQISVTSSSIGSGANPNAQSQDQQNHRSQNSGASSAPSAPVYRDDVPRSPYPSAPLNELASVGSTAFGASARLSVHA